MKLLHVSLGHKSYAAAGQLQDLVVRRFLDLKHATPGRRKDPPTAPVLITFTPSPVYTTGRRELGKLSNLQRNQLTLVDPLGPGTGTAELFEALRGGQTTYHGPGQLVAYPIVFLQEHGLGARDYVQLLQRAVQSVCSLYGVETMTDCHAPGVWTRSSKGHDKISAVGVHLRRYVSSHGIALNVTHEPVPWLRRIVACGLTDRGATSLHDEGATHATIQDAGNSFAGELARQLNGISGVASLDQDALGL